jgi:hypothetical protein
VPKRQTATVAYQKTHKRTTKHTSPAAPARKLDFFIRTAVKKAVSLGRIREHVDPVARRLAPQHDDLGLIIARSSQPG